MDSSPSKGLPLHEDSQLHTCWPANTTRTLPKYCATCEIQDMDFSNKLESKLRTEVSWGQSVGAPQTRRSIKTFSDSCRTSSIAKGDNSLDIIHKPSDTNCLNQGSTQILPGHEAWESIAPGAWRSWSPPLQLTVQSPHNQNGVRKKWRLIVEIIFKPAPCQISILAKINLRYDSRDI